MKKQGLIPIFSTSYVANICNDYVAARVNKEVAILIRIGEQFVKNARIGGEYTDRTGNLRSSIGYILLQEGKVINQNITGNKSEGKQIANRFADELKQTYGRGLVLVGFAGMEYAAAVEAKGYDVISGSAPTRESMKKAFEMFLS